MALLSVVLPSYNEEGNIENTADVLSNLLKEADINYELVFVDYGSTDNTYPLILKKAEENPHIKGISFQETLEKKLLFSPVFRLRPAMRSL